MSDDTLNWGSVQAPYSQEAEEATLGAVLVNPNVYVPVSAALKPDDFFILRHRYIWEALTSLHERGEPVDYLTVMQELKDNKKLNEIGGPAYLTQLINSTPTSVHGEVYAGIVNSFATRRRLMTASDLIKGLALRSDITIERVIGEAIRTLSEAAQNRSQKGEIIAIIDSMHRFMDMVEARYKTEGEVIVGIPTGYKDLDEATNGMIRRMLTIVAGRPSMGKTALVLNLMLNAAKAGFRCFMSSQEMSEEQLMARLSGMEGDINTRTLERGSLNSDELTRFFGGSGQLAKLSIGIDYTRNMTPGLLYQKCQEQKQRTGLDLVVVDGLWLMEDDVQHDTDSKKFEAIIRKIFNMAGDLNVHVLLTHQLNRAVELRTNKRPVQSDLREAGEQSADNIWLLYRDEYYNTNTEFPGVTDIIIAKQRTGPVGTVKLFFDKTTTRFHGAVERELDFEPLNRISIKHNGRSAMPPAPKERDD